MIRFPETHHLSALDGRIPATQVLASARPDHSQLSTERCELFFHSYCYGR